MKWHDFKKEKPNTFCPCLCCQDEGEYTNYFLGRYDGYKYISWVESDGSTVAYISCDRWLYLTEIEAAAALFQGK